MGLWKAGPDLLLVINSDIFSISHRFQVISDCLQTGNDVTPFLRSEAQHLKYKWDSESQTPTYYVWLFVTFALYRNVSELLAIVYKPEMTS